MKARGLNGTPSTFLRPRRQVVFLRRTPESCFAHFFPSEPDPEDKAQVRQEMSDVAKQCAQIPAKEKASSSAPSVDSPTKSTEVDSSPGVYVSVLTALFGPNPNP